MLCGEFRKISRKRNALMLAFRHDGFHGRFVGAVLTALELAGPRIGVGAKPRLSSAALKRFWGEEPSA